MPFTTSFTPLARATTARAEAVNALITAIMGNFALLPAPEKIAAGTVTYAADTGAADAYVVTLDPAPSAYSEGQTVDFKASAANTGASTINVNGLGVKSIRAYDGAELVAGQIPAGGIVTVRYDGTVFRLNNVVGVNIPEDASVTTAKLVDGAVTTAKLADLSVTTAKFAASAVTNAKLANMAQATVKGRASGAGTGAPVDLTATQLLDILATGLNAAYAQLGSANTFTASQTITASFARLNWFDTNFTTGSNKFSMGAIADGTLGVFALNDNGTLKEELARFEPAGTSVSDSQAAMTLEKSDARYAKLNTQTGATGTSFNIGVYLLCIMDSTPGALPALNSTQTVRVDNGRYKVAGSTGDVLTGTWRVCGVLTTGEANVGVMMQRVS